MSIISESYIPDIIPEASAENNILERDSALFKKLEDFLGEDAQRLEKATALREDRNKKLETINNEKIQHIHAIEEILKNSKMPFDEDKKGLEDKMVEVEEFLRKNYDYFFTAYTTAHVRVTGKALNVELGAVETKKRDLIDFTAIRTTEVVILRHLALNGVDLNKLDIEQFTQYKESALKHFNALLDSSDYAEVEGEFFKQTESLYHESLKSRFEDICKIISTSKELTTEVQAALKEFDEFFSIVNTMETRNQETFSNSIRDTYLQLIKTKENMQKTIQQELANSLEQNEDYIMGTFGVQLFRDIMKESRQQEKPAGVEQIYEKIFGLTKQEKKERRARNWKRVNEYLVQFEDDTRYLQVEDLSTIHTIAMAGLIPKYAMGIRYENNLAVGANLLAYTKGDVKISHTSMTGKAVVYDGTNNKYELRQDLQEWVNKANQLGRSSITEGLAQIKMGTLMAKYVNIHPHIEGNGTVVIFAIEAIKAMRHTFEHDRVYNKNHDYRVADTLGWNPFAIAAVAIEHNKMRIANNEA